MRDSRGPVELTKAVDIFSFGCLIPHVASCVYPEPHRDPLGRFMYAHGIYNIVKFHIFHCIFLLLFVLNSFSFFVLCTGVLYVDYIATSYYAIYYSCSMCIIAGGRSDYHMRAHYIDIKQKHVFVTMMMRCLEKRPTARGTFEDVLEDIHALLRKYGRNNQTETLEGNKVRLLCFQCICA